MKKILINCENREIRVAILEDELLTELYIESLDNKTILNNIYKGRIEGVIPGLKAAFVNIGLERNAFLHFDDIRPDILTEHYNRLHGVTPAATEDQTSLVDGALDAETGQEIAADISALADSEYQPSPEELETVAELSDDETSDVPSPIERVVQPTTTRAMKMQSIAASAGAVGEVGSVGIRILRMRATMQLPHLQMMTLPHSRKLPRPLPRNLNNSPYMKTANPRLVSGQTILIARTATMGGATRKSAVRAAIVTTAGINNLSAPMPTSSGCPSQPGACLDRLLEPEPDRIPLTYIRPTPSNPLHVATANNVV